MKYAAVILLVLLTACNKTTETASPVQAKIVTAAPHVPNINTGKQLAQAMCAVCHGMSGTQRDAPFIAGLNAQYMLTVLQAYQSSKRSAHANKLEQLKLLTPEQLLDVSAYYAGLDSIWQGAGLGVRQSKASLNLSKQAIAAGAVIAERCNSCHGENGNSVLHKEAPSLAGMPPEYFVYALNTYFDERRKHKIMKVFGMQNSLSKQEIEQLAAYYAAQLPKRVSNVMQGNAALIKPCEACHGPDGNSLNPALPNLTGQPVEYLLQSMRAYRDGQRHHAAMKHALKNYSDAQLADIAAYFASREPVVLHLWRAQSAKNFRPIEDGKRIAKMCDSCHANAHVGVPHLTGLSARYLTDATIAYRDGVWKHGLMRDMVAYLSDEDIEKVSFYYATQSPSMTNKTVNFDEVVGKKIKQACAVCHNEESIKDDARIPNLNGQDQQYLLTAFNAYASGQRKHEDMQRIAQIFIQQEPHNLIDVTGYFAAQKANLPNGYLLMPIAERLKQCQTCHGVKGEISNSSIPRLAGQSESYLFSAMRAYQNKQRNVAHISALGLMEMKGLAAYYASKKIQLGL